MAVAVQTPWTQSAAVLPKRLALHALAILCLLHATPRLRAGWATLLAGILTLWQALAWTASDTGWLGLPRLLDETAALALFCAVTGGRIPRQVFLKPLIAAAALGAALGLLQQWVDIPGLAQATRPSGLFVSRAVAGEYVAASVVLTVVFLTGRWRPFTLVLLGIQVAFLISTRSRTGWAVGFLALAWVCSRLATRERLRVGATTALAVLLALLLTPGPRLAWRSPTPYSDSLSALAHLELAGRLDTWRNTLEMVKAHPVLGVGPGGFAPTYAAFHRTVTKDRAFSAGQQIEEPHNEPLRLAVEGGVPGLALGGLLAAALLFKRPRHASVRTIALLAALGCLGLSSLVSLTFVAIPTLVLTTCTAGLLGRRGAKGAVHIPSLVGRGAFLTLAATLVWVDLPQWRASRAWRQAEEAARQGSLRSAYERLQAAAADTRDATAYARTAQLAQQAGDSRRCTGAAREGLRHAPRSTRLLSLLGECETHQGNTDAARKAYARNLQLLPDDPWALLGLARLSTGPEHTTLLQQAAEAARLEWTRLPPTLSQPELERLEQLSRQIAQELTTTEGG
ncbi:O-antigen ligase family protein [Vitiosangium sp. GDMCC 1.1324]|uniref:O-antigen ligase family protein n=1 Tax=Vitiosangium sp. (strain GDMCC 1.1324) TaxID=2138576 RepID=UPI00130EAF85|nr:O-antigen ligase family protein [Vitiosangium sp. GDMCC 1.1324]